MLAERFSTYLDREYLREDTRLRHHEAETSRASGVHFAGMEPDSFRARSEAEIHAAAQRAYHQACDFGNSARGRFVMALRQLELLGFGSWAETARCAASRGFMDSREPASIREVAVALRELAAVQDLDVDQVATGAVAEAACALAAILSEPRINKAA